MKNEKVAISVLSLFCVFYGLFGLTAQIKRYESDDVETLYDVAPEMSGERFFHFSPTEQYLMESHKELWPEIFNARNPLTPAGLPLLYRKMLDLARGPELTSLEILELRQWSVLANSNHLQPLKKTLFEGLEKEKSFKRVLDAGNQRKTEPCSLRSQDRAFRLIQAGVFQKEAEKFLAECNPKSLDVLWFQILREAEKKEQADFSPLQSKMKSMMSAAGTQESFKKWYLMDLFNLLHMLEARKSPGSPKTRIPIESTTHSN